MITTLMFLTLSLPAQEASTPGEPGNIPSLELLEYIGGMEEDEDGELMDPLDLPAAEPKPFKHADKPPFAPSAREKLSTP